MNRLILIAGVTAIIAAAGAGASVAQTQAPARAPAAQGAPTPPPPGMGSPGMGMRGMRGGRMNRGGGLTVQEAQAVNAVRFAQLDANKDGRATFEEFRAFRERQRLERQRQAFQRLSGGQDSVTLDQLNARTAERFSQRDARRGGGGGGGAR